MHTRYIIPTGLLCVAASACASTPHANEPQTANALMAASMAFYSHTTVYSDAGTASTISDAGDVYRVEFATEFSRDKGLEFVFWDKESGRVDSANRLTVDRNGKIVKRLHSRSEGEEKASLLEATQEIQGVSHLASIFVPRLLYGINFCSCSTNTNARLLSRDSDGSYRLALDSDDSTRMIFAFSPDDYRIVRVDVQRTRGTSHLRVVIDIRSATVPEHRPSSQELPLKQGSE